MASRQEMVDTLPEDTYAQLSSIPTFRLAVKNMEEELEKANPKIKSLPAREKERLAAFTVMQNLGQGLTERGKPNYEGANYRERLKQHALQQENIEESRAMRYQFHKDAQENRAVANQYAQYFNDAVQGKPEALAQAKVTYLKGLEKPVYDITAVIPGDGLIDAKDGTGDKIKIFHSQEGNDVYRVRYSKDPNDATQMKVGKVEKLSESQKKNLMTSAAPNLRQKVAQVANAPIEGLPQIQVNIDDKAIQGIFK